MSLIYPFGDCPTPWAVNHWLYSSLHCTIGDMGHEKISNKNIKKYKSKAPEYVYPINWLVGKTICHERLKHWKG